MKEQAQKRTRVKRRKMRVRNRVFGTRGKPRLSVFRSAKHISAQLIDDVQGRTVAASSSTSPEIKNAGKKGVEAAVLVGKDLGEKAKKVGIESCVFDRGPYRYHGRTKALGDAAREAGLRF
jgi:large subunit ribosomal protein L18